MAYCVPTRIDDRFSTSYDLTEGTPIEIAYGALFLASDESSFMTGSELVIDGGMTAV